MTVLLSILVLTLVACVVGPDLFSFTMLLVFKPEAFVAGSIGVVVTSVAVGLVVLPLTVVNVSISMDESSATVGLVISPVSFVKRAVDPDLDTLAIFAVLLVPFALVLSSVVESDEVASDPADTVISWLGVVIELGEARPDVHDEATGLLDGSVALGVRLPAFHLVRSGFKSVLGLDGSSGHDSLKVGLDESGSIGLVHYGPIIA